MKKFLVFGLMCALTACGSQGERAVQSVVDTEHPTGVDEVDTDEHVLNPLAEEEYMMTPGLGKASSFKFAQTNWKECLDALYTGNYYGYNCVSSRGISVILKKFMDGYMYQCVNEGLAAQGGGQVGDLHIVHAGIFADPRHSPRSMHSENRAIDIKSMEVKLTSGAVKNFIYEGTANRPFYTAFRNCWGRSVSKGNGCPLYKGSNMLTASIGWENSDHQHHMHTSVPYCINGSYGPYYYQK